MPLTNDVLFKMSQSHTTFQFFSNMSVASFSQIPIGGQILETTECFQILQNVISKQIITKTESVLDVKIADTSDIWRRSHLY